MSHPEAKFDAALEGHRLYEDGITSLKGAFDRGWGPQLLDDYQQELAVALEDGTTKSRGPNRFWFPARPERVAAFIGLAMHPYITKVSEEVLGPDYEIVELGFDEPSQGATNQPWHRDFVMSPTTRDEGRLDYLVFNVTLKDVTPDMGPFEVAPGTQFKREPEFELARGMFVHKRHYPYFDEPGNTQIRMGRLGDIQARTPLTFHRGTVHTSPETRPVMVLGACSPEVPTPVHSLPVSEEWMGKLTPIQREFMQRHVRHEVVATLGRVATPGTDVEELMMGKEDLIPY